MKPADIYNWTPIREDKCLYTIEKHICEDLNHQSIFVEGDVDLLITTKHYIDHMSDDRRGHWMFSVWFKDQPVMICVEAGREGDDHTENFITDKKCYWEMISYIRDLIGVEDYNPYYDPNDDVDSLDYFYGIQTADYYDPALPPHKHKVGDIVNVELRATHQYDNPLITTRVRIKSINEFCKVDGYFGTQIDRKLSLTDGVYGIVDAPNEGTQGATFSETQIK